MIESSAMYLRQIPNKYFTHAKVHQKPPLSFHAQLNEWCDALATQGRSLPRNPTHPMQLPGCWASLLIQNQLITLDYCLQIRAAAMSQDSWSFYQDKYEWSDVIIDNIDWFIHGH
jgi:hypothetical protein